MGRSSRPRVPHSASMPRRRGLGALLQRAGGAHHQLAELDDADVGRPEMLPGAVLDRALAVLDRGILIGNAADAGEAQVFCSSRSSM